MATPANLQETAARTSYGYAFLSKSKLLLNTATSLGNDILKISDSWITEFFMQCQAAMSLGSNSATNPDVYHATNFTFKNLTETSRNYLNILTNHPISVFAKTFCFYKQTTDFGIASFQWAKGNRSSSSLLQHASNTALAYIPLLVSSAQITDSIPLQIGINTLTIACLFYSIKHDITYLKYKESRESSPSICIMKRHLLPVISSISNKIFG